MKRLRGILLIAAVLWGLSAILVRAAPPHQGDGAALVPTDISWTPATVNPGDTVNLIVTYQNQGQAALPQDADVGFSLFFKKTDEPSARPVGETFTSKLPDAGGLPVGEIGSVTGTLVAPAEGQYVVFAVLDMAGNEPADTGDNIRTEPFVVESVLPPSVARLFAGLGVFAAVMAIMAVGTEVIIDSIKLLVGMKQKVTALEAMDKLKQELPGQLASLGVDEESLKKVDELFRGLDTTLKPTTTLVNVYDQIKRGDFRGAFEAIQALAPAVGTATDEEFKTLKENAANQASAGFCQLRARLRLGKELTDEVERHVLLMIEGVTPTTALTLLESVFAAIQKQAPQWTEAWLRSQMDVLFTRGKGEVMKHLEDSGAVVTALQSLGFEKTVIQDTRARLQKAMDSAERVTREKADTYTLAVRNLLRAVEERRNLMQSPLRKFYRRLRDNNTLPFWGTLVGILVGVAIACGAALLISSPGAWLLGLAGGLVGGLLAGWIASRAKGPSLGYALRYWFERFYNQVSGSPQDPNNYGQVDSKVLEQIERMGPTSVARVLLEREDQHRDEEASRLRIFRALSIMVGIVLAYVLQIDAAVLLDQVVPNISSQINAILNISGPELHRIWPALSPTSRLTAGIILTGLAASAGSKFWHDLLGRLESTKEQAEAAAKLIRQAKSLTEPEESRGG